MSKPRASVDVQRDTAQAPTSSRETWAPLSGLRDEIDRLFEDFGTGFWRHPLARRTQPAAGNGAGIALSPVIEVVARNGGYAITAELPGLGPEDVEIRVSDGMLTIRGEKTEETHDEQASYLMSERHYGAFQRSLRLPAGTDPDKITAELAHGVLTLTLPKTAEAIQKERKIEIKTA
jgi:HSP20 family protein